MLFQPGIALSSNRHNTFSRVKNTKPSGPRPPKKIVCGGGGNNNLAPPPLTLGGHGLPDPPAPTPLYMKAYRGGNVLEVVYI